MSDRKRISAGLLCVVFVMALLVSSAFIIHEANHDCTGEDCPICRAIAANGELLRLSGTAVFVLFALTRLLRAGYARGTACGLFAPASETLESLKIRLND